MAKYRLLTQEELTELEPEFIKYLILNGIDADTWKKLKLNKPDEANQIIDLFSDVVFEKVLREAEYLKLQSKATIRVIRCDKDIMSLIAINLDPNNQEEVYTGTKKYLQNREVEIFNLLQQGYEISDGSKYNELTNAINSKKNGL